MVLRWFFEGIPLLPGPLLTRATRAASLAGSEQLADCKTEDA